MGNEINCINTRGGRIKNYTENEMRQHIPKRQ